MHRAKGFNSSNGPDLAEQVSRWLAENPKAQIVSVTQSQSTEGSAGVKVNCVIIYKTEAE